MTPLLGLTEQAMEWLSWTTVMRGAQALLAISIAFVLARLAAAVTRRVVKGRGDRQSVLLMSRAAQYVVLGAGVLLSLRLLGFDPRVLLGAAGILTVAIGFASQTSASNLISGLFLLGERPFVVGHIIRVDQLTGEVVSVDLMSIKLRTFDNLYVRIPNESIHKSQITNLSHYPIRRCDVTLSVSYDADIGDVRERLFALADANPKALDEPRPLVIVQEFSESTIRVQFSVWASRENFVELKNSLMEQLQGDFYGAGGFAVPYTRRVWQPLAPAQPESADDPPEPR